MRTRTANTRYSRGILFGVKLKMHNTLTMLSIVFGVAASLFGIWAALSEVRDSQDDFIADLKTQGRRAGIAAMCAAISRRSAARRSAIADAMIAAPAVLRRHHAQIRFRPGRALRMFSSAWFSAVRSSDIASTVRLRIAKANLDSFSDYHACQCLSLKFSPSGLP